MEQQQQQTAQAQQHAKDPIKEKKTRPHAFFYSNDAAAVVYLLRASDSTTWKKFCPDIENHGAATGADDIMMSMFRALHGGLEQTDDLADEGGSKSERFLEAYQLTPKVGRPRREVAIREEADRLYEEEKAERQRKLRATQERQRYAGQPAGHDAKGHIGGFTTRGTRVEPVKEAAVVQVTARRELAMIAQSAAPLSRLTDLLRTPPRTESAVRRLAREYLRVCMRLPPQVPRESLQAGGPNPTHFATPHSSFGTGGFPSLFYTTSLRAYAGWRGCHLAGALRGRLRPATASPHERGPAPRRLRDQ